MYENRKKLVVDMYSVNVKDEKQQDIHEAPKLARKGIRRKAAVSLMGVFAMFGIIRVGMPSVYEEIKSCLTPEFDLTKDFGQLRFVSNMLPQSAQVFLQNDSGTTTYSFGDSAVIKHAWTKEEPWITYTDCEAVRSCMAGEVMGVTKNRSGLFTVRILHDNETESLYSGLSTVSVSTYSRIREDQCIGFSEDSEYFYELRKNGISIKPLTERLLP